MGEEITGRFKDHEGVELFRRCRVEANDRGALVVCHGLGEHSGRYTGVFEAARKAGLSYFALDHRGFGQSAGKRGVIDRFDQFLLGVRSLVEFAREKIGAGKKVFLFGHSMGGLIAVRYAQRFPESIDGLIPHGASFRLALEVPKVKAALGNLMSGLWPGLTLANELDPKVLSHDPEAVKAYLADPLVHDRISTRLFTEIMANMAEANAHAGVIAMPLLVIHGGADRLTHPEGSRAFYDAAASHDKTLKMFDGLYHETFHELDKEKVLETLREWLAARA